MNLTTEKIIELYNAREDKALHDHWDWLYGLGVMAILALAYIVF